jgi:hypothetical protein
MEHFTPGAKRIGVNGTDNELIDFILIFIYLCICGLYNDTVSSSDYVASMI